ncbi:DUF4301 family protein [Saccharicrinis sp. FJH54]|uniref:DUF4301 family protein n=1 Tax=Saccharicrinis sp. FJH54 TaxID=3344665 RepID=UPI0035D4D786
MSIFTTKLKNPMFTDKDLEQLADKGIEKAVVEDQVETFKRGIPFLNIKEPATPQNGIVVLDQTSDKIEEWEKALKKGISVVKFVPASGAASRMFKDLFYFLNKQETYPERESVKTFFKKVEDFAFFEDLSDYLEDMDIDDGNYFKKMVSRLLDKSGMGYGVLPKGLLKFHKYKNGARTAFEEHLVEGAMYARQTNSMVNLHFTVSEEHMVAFTKLQKKIQLQYEKELGVKFDISYSVQKPSTDTVAVNMDNTPFRNEDNSLLFRPGGHGALLENLNELDADVIYIKNIDNVVPDHFKEPTVTYKKALAGILMDVRNKVFTYLEDLNKPTEELISEVRQFIESELYFRFNDNFEHLDFDTKVQVLKQKLDRPIRVCGMVKNEGEPGGGPYWVVDSEGNQSLQIAEMSQLDADNDDVKALISDATHFNPVDLVCSVKKVDGTKYDLRQFKDPETGFISYKSKDGKDLKALELPGLWNGAMAYWSTIFVEVPVATFNPVKEVNDLLRKEHQPA